MKKRNARKKKQSLLFNPDSIVDNIHQELYRDFGITSSTLLYGNMDDPNELFLFNQLTNFQKKYERSDNNDNTLADNAYSTFSTTCEHLRSIDLDNLRLYRSDTRLSQSMPVFDRVMLRARSLCSHILGDLDEDEWFTRCTHGSGSTVGVSYEHSCNIEQKWTFPLSGTSSCCRLFDRYLTWNEKFRLSLLEHNDPLDHDMYQIVRGSRTTTVPKDNKTKRLIAVEPTLNMFFQKGLEAIMVDRLRSYGLDVEVLQETHKDIAWINSMTKSHATIDFSSASDCVSLELSKFILPPKWFSVLSLVRSPESKILDSFVELPMISTMGNATTFPLETLIFYSIAIASCLEKTNSNTYFPTWEILRSCSVFGDDCIVPTESAPLFMEVCEKVGFIVNKEKSFFGDESFRESCGGDYCHGRNVRPFYIKRPTNTKQSSLEPWLYVITNRILKKYIQYFGSLTYIYHTNVLTYVANVFQQNNITIKCVPADFPDDAGLKIINDFERIRPVFRWNHFSPVIMDESGHMFGRYLRFVYKKSNGSLSDVLHYEESLRIARRNHQPIFDPDLSERRHVSRKAGRYVVSKGSFGFTNPIKAQLTPLVQSMNKA